MNICTPSAKGSTAPTWFPSESYQSQVLKSVSGCGQSKNSIYLHSSTFVCSPGTPVLLGTSKDSLSSTPSRQSPSPFVSQVSKKVVKHGIGGKFSSDIDKLIIKEAYCGKQIVMKRFRARAKGRASPILKPYSNLTIILSEKEKEKEKVVKHGTKS